MCLYTACLSIFFILTVSILSLTVFTFFFIFSHVSSNKSWNSDSNKHFCYKLSVPCRRIAVDFGPIQKNSSLSTILEDYLEPNYRNVLRFSRRGLEKFVAYINSHIHRCDQAKSQIEIQMQCMIFLNPHNFGTHTTIS